MSVLASFMLVTVAREEVFKDIEIRKIDENSKNSKNGNKDLGTNLAQVFYI